MSCLHYREHELFIEDVRLTELAREYGTPCYIYSRLAIVNNFKAYDQAFANLPHQLCYAVKANSNIAILQLLAQQGAGFDIVSIGELKRVIAAGGDPAKVIFSGVGKTKAEIEEAIHLGIFCFNIESEPEVERIAAIAASLNTTVNIMLRVNPDVDAKTHSYISTGKRDNKFGMHVDDILSLAKILKTRPSLRLIGIGAHIGSQITDLEPFLLAIDYLLSLVNALQELGMTLTHINIGGGLGITYRDELPPSIAEYAHAVTQKLAGQPYKILFEPGRSIIGNAGALLTQIEYIKDTGTKHYAITDAGMNDLLRPALYHAWQNILTVVKQDLPVNTYDITGPVCESADFLGKERELAIAPGDLLAIDGAGAYGFSMSSNYNSRGRPAEVLVAGNKTHLIRRRETIEDAINLENLLSE
jgi:diaminopimelate decarboxylase